MILVAEPHSVVQMFMQLPDFQMECLRRVCMLCHVSSSRARYVVCSKDE